MFKSVLQIVYSWNLWNKSFFSMSLRELTSAWGSSAPEADDEDGGYRFHESHILWWATCALSKKHRQTNAFWSVMVSGIYYGICGFFVSTWNIFHEYPRFFFSRSHVENKITSHLWPRHAAMRMDVCRCWSSSMPYVGQRLGVVEKIRSKLTRRFSPRLGYQMELWQVPICGFFGLEKPFGCNFFLEEKFGSCQFRYIFFLQTLVVICEVWGQGHVGGMRLFDSRLLRIGGGKDG